jgi:hypothetical protein
MKIMADLIKLGRELLKEIPRSEFINLDDIKEKDTEMLHKEIDNGLYRMLNEVFAWAQHIRIAAQRYKKDGIDDDALITFIGYFHNLLSNKKSILIIKLI